MIKVMGLEDRLWFGYWTGGASMAVTLLTTYFLVDNPGAVLVAVLSWVTLTPVGILIAKRTR